MLVAHVTSLEGPWAYRNIHEPYAQRHKHRRLSVSPFLFARMPFFFSFANLYPHLTVTMTYTCSEFKHTFNILAKKLSSLDKGSIRLGNSRQWKGLWLNLIISRLLHMLLPFNLVSFHFPKCLHYKSSNKMLYQKTKTLYQCWCVCVSTKDCFHMRLLPAS